jgi:tetratricopeptide (TPR) repeat protein
MAKIPLRAYIHDIENLIDRGQTEETLAHCKHILQYYPKCVDVYRLLGKAYLESQRYGEAADVLQRVLSTFPDDFVSQVGMSIVREDEGNLDAAIWHMERAYEAQPSNTAVQDELRRLYGRRDGAEPPRVRLTRGALVRMYARGDLYEQAIAEIKAALTEDPQRPDLQVILAKMYADTGQKVEAMEVCSDLIAHFPFCYEANRILTEILPGTARAEDTQVYRERLCALDPYMTYATTEILPADVPENQIMIEKLDYEAEKEDTSQPAWASSLGVNLDLKSSSPHVLPDWLANLTPTAVQPKPDTPQPPATPVFIENVPPTSHPVVPPPAADRSAGDIENLLDSLSNTEGDKELPNWMQDSGWSTSTGENPEIKPTPSFVDQGSAVDDEGESEIVPAEIPDWLMSLAPTSAAQDSNEMNASQQANSQPPTMNPQPDEPVEQTSSSESMFASIPSWAAPEEKPAPEPDFLSSSSGNDANLQSWLNEIKPADDQVPTPQENTSTPEKQNPSAPNEMETMAWLEELANEHGAEAPTISLRSVDRIANPPSWVKETPVDQSAQTGEEMSSKPQAAHPVEKETMPDWLMQLANSPLENQDQPSAVQEPVQVEKISETIPAAETPTPTEEVVESPNIDLTAGTEPAEPISEIVAPQSESSAPVKQISSQDAELAWLENLAEKQSSAGEIPTVEPSARVEEVVPPSAQDITPAENAPTPEVESTTELPSEAAAEEPAAAQDETELPEWLKFLDVEPQAADEAAPVGNSAAQTPTTDNTWLPEVSAPEEPAPNLENVNTAVDEQVQSEGELPESAPVEVFSGEETPIVEIQPVIDEQPAAADLSAQPVDDVADWLSKLEETGPAYPEETPVEEAQPSNDVAASEAATAANQFPEEIPPAAEPTPIDEDKSQVVRRPQPDKMPDWMQDFASDQTNQPGESQPAETVKPVQPPSAEPEIIPSEVPAYVSEALKASEFPSQTIEPGVYEEEPTTPLPEQSAYEEPTQITPAFDQASLSDNLVAAQASLQHGHIKTGMLFYEQVIKNGYFLDETIHDLRDALYRYPVDITIWQALGDAYVRSNRIQEALDAYTKAEELLR